MFASQAGLFRRPQYPASSNASWASTTISAVWSRSVMSGSYDA